LGWGADGGCGAKRVTRSEQNRRMGRPRSTSWTRSMATAPSSVPRNVGEKMTGERRGLDDESTTAGSLGIFTSWAAQQRSRQGKAQHLDFVSAG
jgi:hypothetical protein